MRIIVNGTPYDDYEHAEVTKSLDDLAGSFSFAAAWDVGSKFPFKAGDSVKIEIEGQQVIDGFVDSISPNISKDSASVDISGADKTIDIVDSTLPADAGQFVSGAQLSDVIKKVINAIGANIGVVNNVQGLEPFLEDDIISSFDGQGAFEFIDALAKKRQVLLTTDGAGNVVITRSGTEQTNYELVDLLNDSNNTILYSTATVNEKDRFHRYTFSSQINIAGAANAGKDISTDDQNIVGQDAYDNAIRSSRVLYMQVEESSDENFATKRAAWECNIRRARSKTYTATTDGHVDNSGKLFWPNKLIQVKDYSCNVFENMLIKSVSFSTSDAGNTTSLDLVVKDAYTLQLEEPLADVKASKEFMG